MPHALVVAKPGTEALLQSQAQGGCLGWARWGPWQQEGVETCRDTWGPWRQREEEEGVRGSEGSVLEENTGGPSQAFQSGSWPGTKPKPHGREGEGRRAQEGTEEGSKQEAGRERKRSKKTGWGGG